MTGKSAKVKVDIVCEQLNPDACKTYLIAVRGAPEAVLIDPVIDQVKDYVRLLEQRKLILSMVIDTHTHADHISGGASLKNMLGCEYAMHDQAPASCATIRLADGSVRQLCGQIPVRVLYTPGHTRDSLSLIFPDRIFTGDALFLDDGGAGRDDLPGGDPGAHWETLRKFEELPEYLTVFPAHDYRYREPSSLKQQKKTNPHLIKSREGKNIFVQYLEDMQLGPADWMKDVLQANYACTLDPRAASIPAEANACEVKGSTGGVSAVAVASLSVQTLQQQVNADPPPVLLDVREKKELRGPLGHLPGIVHIPIGQLGSRLAEFEQYKDREIVTICRSGRRATAAAQILQTAGFPHVAVLEGGMLAWNGLPYK